MPPRKIFTAQERRSLVEHFADEAERLGAERHLVSIWPDRTVHYGRRKVDAGPKGALFEHRSSTGVWKIDTTLGELNFSFEVTQSLAHVYVQFKGQKPSTGARTLPHRRGYRPHLNSWSEKNNDWCSPEDSRCREMIAGFFESVASLLPNGAQR